MLSELNVFIVCASSGVGGGSIVDRVVVVVEDLVKFSVRWVFDPLGVDLLLPELDLCVVTKGFLRLDWFSHASFTVLAVCLDNLAIYTFAKFSRAQLVVIILVEHLKLLLCLGC